MYINLKLPLALDEFVPKDDSVRMLSQYYAHKMSESIRY